MKISWQGHASFVMESEKLTLVTDPFDEQLGYPHICRRADVVTISHRHWDHDAVHVFEPYPQVIMGPGFFQCGHISVYGVPSCHDTKQGAVRGANTIYCIEAEDMRIIHLGDLGHVPEEQAELIGKPDILMVPIGGTYTLDAEAAWQTIELLQPRMILPMHYLTPVCKLDIAPVEPFLERCTVFSKKPWLEISPTNLPEEPSTVVVLDYLR